MTADLVARDVRDAFVALCKPVWEGDVAPLWTQTPKTLLPSLSDVRALWERQTGGWFDIMWTLGAGPALAARKNWRTHSRSAEPGEKCALMGDLQELSCADGASGDEPNHVFRTDSRKQFWEALSRRVGALNVSPDEHLCAIALVKRRFAHYFGELDETLLSGLRICGAPVPEAVPSTAGIAVAPWLAVQLAALPQERLSEIEKEIPRGAVQNLTPLRCVSDAVQSSTGQRLAHVDARLWFARREDRDEEYSADELKRFIAARNALGVTAPTPFFAVLRMDVDHLGAAGKTPAAGRSLAQALAAFADTTRTEVENHSGYLIYCGGDDMLALLPLESALSCAVALRGSFQQILAAVRKGSAHDVSEAMAPVTLSASVVFAHQRSPLTRSLALSATALNDDAKDGAGRDAIAIVVAKPGGIAARWVQPWERALAIGLDDTAQGDTGGARVSRQLVLEALAAALSHIAELGSISSRFLYKLEQVFELAPLPLDAALAELPASFELAEALAAAQYMASFKRNRPSLEEARKVIRPLLEQCLSWRRIAFATDGGMIVPPRFELASPLWKRDAALVVRFLATKGNDE